MEPNTLEIPEEKLQELAEEFANIDANGSGFLEEDEVKDALEMVGFKYATYQVRDIIRQYDIHQRDGKIDFQEFKKMYAELKKRDYGYQARKQVKTRDGIEDYGSRNVHANVDIKHSIRLEEQVAFAGWINRNLAHDPLCKAYLPFQEDGRDLYKKCNDGIMLCKVINVSAPETIDVRALNVGSNLSVFKKHENIVLALNSARAIGCNVINIGATDIENGVEHLLLGLLWQIIKVGLLAEINLTHHAELARLLLDGETLEDLRKLTPVELLLRWVNYHLKESGCKRRINNFSEDIKDSEAYSYLLQQIAPADKKRNLRSVQEVLRSNDRHARANDVLDNAEQLDARVFVTANDIVAGNPNLNLAFVANLFNLYPALEQVEPIEDQEEIIETREEKTFRNWMNSVGVNPHVNYLYNDLRDGLIIFQLYDIIQPGKVDWKRVNQKFSKLKKNFEILENCNYAVELGKECRFSLVGIGGEDLRDGNRTLTLALVWQLMRAYTLAVLAKLTGDGKRTDDKMILAWAQQKLASSGKKSTISSFQDSSLHNGLALIDLVDAVNPDAVNYTLVKKTSDPTDWLDNAKYAISVARKCGATVYALPEDITEVKSKMILTMVACLMVLDHQKLAGSVGGPRSAGSTGVF